MILMSVYVALVLVSEVIATVAGFYFEAMFPVAGLTVYLLAFFVILVVMWPIAIRLTAGEDKVTKPS